MANIFTTQTLYDSGKKPIVQKFTGVFDTATEEVNVVKVDVSTLSLDGITCTDVVIDKIWYDINGMVVNMLWDATTPVTIMTLSDGQHEFCFRDDFGGLTNNAGVGKTGDIKFTTIGAGIGDSYTIILEMRKKI